MCKAGLCPASLMSLQAGRPPLHGPLAGIFPSDRGGLPIRPESRVAHAGGGGPPWVSALGISWGLSGRLEILRESASHTLCVQFLLVTSSASLGGVGGMGREDCPEPTGWGHWPWPLAAGCHAHAGRGSQTQTQTQNWSSHLRKLKRRMNPFWEGLGLSSACPC